MPDSPQHVWYRCADPVTEDDIRELESHLGVVFPQDFIELVLTRHGGRPEKDQVTVPGLRFAKVWSRLLLIPTPETANAPGSMLVFNRAVSQLLPAGVVAFVQLGGGDLLCFDYRKRKKNPSIVCWLHDTDEGPTIIPVTATVTELLKLLH